MNRYKKLGKNMALMVIGNFSSKVLSFLFLPLYTAILSTEEYGISELITTTVNLILPFCTLLMTEAVLRFTLDKEYDKKQVFSISLYVCALGILLVSIASPFFLTGVLKDYCLFFVLFYSTTVLHTLVAHFVKGIEEITVYTLGGVVGTITVIAFNILFLVTFRMGIVGYLLAHIVSSVASTVFLCVPVKIWKYTETLKNVDTALLKEMLRYSVPLIPNSMSWWISNSSGKYIVTAFCGVAMNGIYSVAYRIPSIFSIISNIFMSAWQISAVEDFGSEQTTSFYSKIYNIYNVGNMIIVSALICGTKILAGFLFSNDFFQAWVFVPVLLVAYLFNTMASFLGTIYTSAKKTKMIFLTTFIGATANIIFNFLLVKIMGAMGAAVSALISYLLIWLVRFIDSRRIIKLDINFGRNIISYLILGTQCVVMALNSRYSFAISLSLFGLLVGYNYKHINGILCMLSSKIKARKAG